MRHFSKLPSTLLKKYGDLPSSALGSYIFMLYKNIQRFTAAKKFIGKMYIKFTLSIILEHIYIESIQELFNGRIF
jgi:hypothetical protein